MTVSAGNGTGEDNDRMQVDSLKKGKVKGEGKQQNQKGNRTNSTSNTSNTDINTCKWQNWTLGERLLGRAYENPSSNNSNTHKGKSRKVKAKGKVDVVETNQSSETASTVKAEDATSPF